MRPCFAFCLLFFATFATAQSNYYVKFPDDAYLTGCDPFTPPQLYNPDSLALTVEFEDNNFLEIIADGCYKIHRTWTVKRADYEPASPCTYVPNPDPNSNYHSPENLLGVTIAAPDNTLPDWQPTTVKITPADASPTDYSVFFTGGTYNQVINNVVTTITVPPLSQTNCLRYTQILVFVDTKPPVASACPSQPLLFPDVTQNDTSLWHAGYWLDSVSQSHDLREAPVHLSITGDDGCPESGVSIRYLLFLDLDQDGVQETVINSNNLPTASQVNFGNAGNPGYSGGVARAFDQRAVPANQKYLFGLQQSTNGSSRTGTVAWHTAQAPNTWITPQIPPGTHRIKWCVDDNCGNETVCEYTFTVTRNQADYYIKFPDDLFVTGCGNLYTPPVLYNPDSANINITYEDEIFGLSDACFTITRTWYVRDEDYNPALPYTYVPNPHPAIGSQQVAANRPGVTVSAPGNTVPGWDPTTVKIWYQDSLPTDYSVFYTGGNYTTLANGVPTVFTVPAAGMAHGFRYTQGIDIIDVEPPQIDSCPAGSPVFQDNTLNNSLLWNAGYWLDPATQSHDLSEAPVDLTISASDDCSGPGVSVHYILFLDLNQDSVQETVVTNYGNPPAAGQVNFGNALNPNYTGGVPQDFDQRLAPVNLRYRFGLRDTAIGGHRICTIGWHSVLTPNVWTPVQLPPGKHRIKWVFEDACGNQSFCEYAFTVTEGSLSQPPYYIKFPDDIFADGCDSTFTPPLLYNPDSTHLTITHEDNVFGIFEACYTIQRDWYVRSENYDPALPCIEVPNPRPSGGATTAPANRVGVTISAPGNTVPGWAPTMVKIYFQDSLPTDYSVFYTGGTYQTLANNVVTSFTVPPIGMANCYRYVQKVDYNDFVAPVIDYCPAAPPFFSDSTANDSLLWNAAYWLDPGSQTHDLTETPVNLSMTGSDDCAGSQLAIRYLLFLDLDQDGTQETVINSDNLPAPGQVKFGNAFTPNYAGGVPQDFDQRAVPANQKYRFGLQTINTGNNKAAVVAWNTGQAPNVWTPVQLPPGKHQIRWFFDDGCGNETLCQYIFMVADSGLIASTGQVPGNGSLATIRISPNPAPNDAVLHLANLPGVCDRFDLYDGRGRFVGRKTISGDQVALEQTGLPAGLYYFQVFDSGKLRGAGKLSLFP